jgi:hypothetical protein
LLSKSSWTKRVSVVRIAIEQCYCGLTGIASTNKLPGLRKISADAAFRARETGRMTAPRVRRIVSILTTGLAGEGER